MRVIGERIVAAINERLVRMVERKECRQDPVYRLNMLTLHMPALRYLAGDIAAITHHFMRRFGERHGKRIMSLTRPFERLLAHDWPGDVRELQHAIERAVLLADGSSLDVGDIEIGSTEMAAPSDVSFRAAKECVRAAVRTLLHQKAAGQLRR
ncbi:MAG: sigma54 specific transcriptional regulator, Fis family [Cryobacterium sp.]|nr:sigma54 specific transcriptional regulator, Fis family [Cryobacterium sp.]